MQTQALLSLVIRRGELPVGGEDFFAARVKAQVDRTAAEVRREIVVLRFALLPARGDDGDLSLDADGSDRRPEGRIHRCVPSKTTARGRADIEDGEVTRPQKRPAPEVRCLLRDCLRVERGAELVDEVGRQGRSGHDDVQEPERRRLVDDSVFPGQRRGRRAEPETPSCVPLHVSPIHCIEWSCADR